MKKYESPEISIESLVACGSYMQAIGVITSPLSVEYIDGVLPTEAEIDNFNSGWE